MNHISNITSYSELTVTKNKIYENTFKYTLSSLTILLHIFISHADQYIIKTMISTWM